MTKCPDCRRQCFVKFESCPGCGRKFLAGELKTKAAAEDRAFRRKWYTVFFVLLSLLLIALVFVVVRRPDATPGGDVRFSLQP